MDAVRLLNEGLIGLQLIERELLLFAAFWFIVSAIDELAIDLGLDLAPAHRQGKGPPPGAGRSQ
jgi:hypothetical protein